MAKALGGGVRLASLVLLSALLAFSAAVLAGDFSSTAGNSTYEAQTAAHSFNISVSNTDVSSNITEVNITLPAGFIYITDSNQTSGTSDFYNDSTNITWFNTASGLVNTSQIIYFLFDALANTTPGYYDFIVTTLDDGAVTNSTTVNITIQDTTDPVQVILITPGNDTWTNSSSTWINYSFTELNPDYCLYDNSSSNTSQAAGSGYCNISVTGYPEGTWDYWLYVNDTSGNLGMNGTYILKYDATPPASESLELMYQGSDKSGGTITTRANVTIRASVTEAGSGVYQALAMIYNESDYNILNLTLQNQSGYWQADWDTINEYSGAGEYTVNITLNDTAGNYVPDENSTTVHFVGAPDLQVAVVDWFSDNAVSGHPNSGDNITLNISVTNSGDENFTDSINVTVKIGTTYYPTYEKDRTSIANTSLEDGETAYYNVTFSSGNFTSDDTYYFYLQADPEGAVNETLDTNNDYSLNLTLGYNVTLETVNNGTEDFAWPDIVKGFPDTNLTFTVHVSYANGDAVNGLNFTHNFTFASSNAAGTETDPDLISRNGLIFQSEGSGDYAFNLTIHDLYTDTGVNDNETRTYPGIWNLNIGAHSGDYYGYGNFTYNVTAPQLQVSIDIDDTSYTGSAAWVNFYLNITNVGNMPASSLLIDQDDDWGYFSFITDIDTDGNLILGSLDPGEEWNLPLAGDDLRVEIDGIYTDTDKSLWVLVHYQDSEGNAYIGFDNDRFTASDGTGGEEDPGTGGTTGGTESNLVFGLTLTDWEDEIQGYPGESNTTRVEVKNSGDLTAVVKVSFTCDPVANAAIAPTSKSVAVNSRQEFVIGLDIDPDAEIGEYDCKVRAYVSTSESDYDEEIIVLKVLATPEAAAEISEEYQNISARVQGLLRRFALVNPALVNDTNLTKVDNLLKNANDTIKSIWDSIQAGDYITAKELMDALEASLLVTESALADLETEMTRGGGTALSGTWLWAVIIIVVVIAVAFVAYMLFPQKGYGPKKSILGSLSETLRGGGSKLGSIKDSGKSRLGGLGKKDSLKPKSYSGGSFRKQPSGYGQGPAARVKGAIGKLKEKLRRKRPQKEVTQYFASSSSKMISYS